MTSEELVTGTALNAEIVDLTNKIAAINSANYVLDYTIVGTESGDFYDQITDDLTTAEKAALKATILANLQASLVIKQAAFDAL